MEITLASTGQVDDVTELWIELARGQRTHGSHILPEENRSTARDAVLRHTVADELAVAVVDRTVVGFVMFTVETGEYRQDRTRGLIRNIYVRPDDRNEGIGTALLEAAESELADRDADRVTLEAMADNDAARRFYRRHGYEPHRVAFEKSTESDTL
ncbi:GNAT family N-acetyltransferase [Halomicrobium sp. HM KBTZ05]|uniref:GNAT family N-acetyltransferase n=1 Tax=Halomicrobium sp. HM KBTZ05 TaxID=3242663 RepID=UPI003555D7DC